MLPQRRRRADAIDLGNHHDPDLAARQFDAREVAELAALAGIQPHHRLPLVFHFLPEYCKEDSLNKRHKFDDPEEPQNMQPVIRPRV